MKKILLKIYWLISFQLGFDIRKTIKAFLNFPRFILDMVQFRSSYKGRFNIFPCLHDKDMQAGSVQDEYFLQDLYIAQKIFKANPNKHIDVGSRVDGFVAHIASFREIEVFDIRVMPMVIKNKDNRREHYNREKMASGIRL